MYIPYFRINKQTICSKWRRLKWRHIFQSSSYIFLICLVAHTFYVLKVHYSVLLMAMMLLITEYVAVVSNERFVKNICDLSPFFSFLHLPLFLLFSSWCLGIKMYFFNIEENRYLSGISVENFKRSWVLISEFESLRSTK